MSDKIKDEARVNKQKEIKEKRKKRKINISLTLAVLLLLPGSSLFIGGRITTERNISGEEASSGGIAIYVDDSNIAGPWNGTMDFPYQYVQDGVDNAFEYDTVFVFNGTYYENVIVDKAIDLVGENATAAIIDGMQSDDPLWINTSFVNVSGFTVTNSPRDGWSQGIHVVDKKWHGPDDPYITLTDIVIFGCIVEGNDCGIRLDNTRNVKIASCVIRNNYGLSVYNIYSSQVCIHHCMIENNGNEHPGGITICKDPDLGDSEDVEVFNCTIIDNVFAGILIDGGSSQINVHHNGIKRNSGKGIFVSSSSAPTYNVSIQDNDIFGNRGGGSSAGGICLQDCSDSVSMERNRISSSARGIYLLRSSGTTIIDNAFTSNGCGINLDGSSNNFIDTNTIIANNNEGIALSYSNNNTISGNDISSIGLAGISFHSSSNNTISSNTLVNSSYGIFFEYCSNDNHVRNNVLSNSEYGIYFCDSHGNSITNNFISNNNGGINVRYSIDNVFSDNIIVDNTEGICFYDCIDNCIYHNVFYNNSKRNAFFYMPWFPLRSNKWDGNYWERPRLLPYPIFGRIGLNLLIPWVNIDWHPGVDRHAYSLPLCHSSSLFRHGEKSVNQNQKGGIKME